MIDLICDGSCPRLDGPGGWAFIVMGPKVYKEQSGGELGTTNNRMELLAAIKGFEWLEEEGYTNDLVRLTSDSQYVIKGLNEWCFTWRQRGWRRKERDGQWVPIKNKDLWQRLFFLAHETFNVEFNWIRGHAGHRYNERCDALAGEQAWKLIESS